MKFYDRKTEMEVLNSNLEQSKKSACFTVMVGRRRIGKTALLLESFKEKKYLYLFVSRKNNTIDQVDCVDEEKNDENRERDAEPVTGNAGGEHAVNMRDAETAKQAD